MSDGEHQTGWVNSGGIRLFYRHFGSPGGEPVLIMHGANYFDSLDWAEVAGALAADREVAAMDLRGFGQSDWSPNLDYSMDAHMEDIRALMADLGWRRVHLLVHSRAGRMGILFAANYPDQAAGLIIGDSALGNPPGDTGKAPAAKPPLIFATLEEAMEHFSGNDNPPRISWDKARARAALSETDEGLMLKRDPNFANSQPLGEGARAPRLEGLDIWRELGRVRCPVMILRGTLSDRYPPEKLARIARDYGHIEMREIESHHDLAGQAPEAVIAAVRDFLGWATSVIP
jgi:pimeloyl-ACP methyl ester carboxylesterase